MPPINPLVTELESELRGVIKAQHHIQDRAGPKLEGFSQLKLRAKCEYEGIVAAFWQTYSRLIAQVNDELHTSSYIHTWEDVLRAFYRRYCYAKQGKKYWELSAKFCLRLECPHTNDWRILAAARLYWMQCRKEQNLDVNVNKGRYANLKKDRQFLMENLDEQHRWLLDFSIPLTWETSNLLAHMESISDLRGDFNHTIGHMRDFIVHHDAANTPDVASFTRTATTEVLKLCEEHTGNHPSEKDDSCPICSYKYAHTYSDENTTEPAVKTACNHILGSHCLQIWVDGGNSTCPTCRQSMYEMGLMFPKPMQPIYATQMSMLDTFDADSTGLDASIDAALSEGNVEVHDSTSMTFQHLIYAMDTRRQNTLQNTSKLHDMMHRVIDGRPERLDDDDDLDNFSEIEYRSDSDRHAAVLDDLEIDIDSDDFDDYDYEDDDDDDDNPDLDGSSNNSDDTIRQPPPYDELTGINDMLNEYLWDLVDTIQERDLESDSSDDDDMPPLEDLDGEDSGNIRRLIDDEGDDDDVPDLINSNGEVDVD